MPEYLEAEAEVTPHEVSIEKKMRVWRVRLRLHQDLAEGTLLYFVFLGMQRQKATLQQAHEGEDGFWKLVAPGVRFKTQHYQLSAFEVVRVELQERAGSSSEFRLAVHEIPDRRKNMGQWLHAWDRKAFPIFARLPGERHLLGLREMPWARVQPGAPVILRSFGPSTIEVVEALPGMSLRMAYFDSELNPLRINTAELVKRCCCGESAFVASERGGVLRGRIPFCECDEIIVEDRERGLSCRLNPRVKINPDERKLFWGEIHSHGYVDDGTRDIDYNYDYARGAACLDFASQSIHDNFAVETPGVFTQYTPSMRKLEGFAWEQEFEVLSDAIAGVPEDSTRWRYVLDKAEEYNSPGSFVTIPGYEWTASRYKWIEIATGVACGHGHRCVYFNLADPPLLASRDPRYCTPEKLFAGLESYKGNVITIPHHPAAHPEHKTGGWTTDWSRQDPEFDRLAEVFSCHGASEYPGNPRPIPGKCGPPESFVRSALRSGCRMGIIAGTDNHESRPGQIDGGWGDSPGGMIGVWARELTRDSIFEALYNRHCYGVSNMARIVLRFELNGSMMGSELDLPAGVSRELRVEVKGTAEIEDIQIIKNGRPWYSSKVRGHRCSGELDIVDDEEPSETDSYYVTVLQRDGEMAWSSPIWVDSRR